MSMIHILMIMNINHTNTKLNNNTKYARTNKENKKQLKINLLCDRYFQTFLKNDNGRPFSHNAK